jgi:tetratricopeptide (TPR) repeat protein
LVAILLVAAVMGALLGRFVFAGSDDAPSSVVRQPKAQSIGQLQEQIRVGGESASLLTNLGVAYLNQARATADPSWYTKAGEALQRAHALAPDDARTLTGAGLLALARHDFTLALSLGQRAHSLEPVSPDALGVIVDAEVELGRYPAAAATAQEMVDRRPSLASLSRVSYVRELHGDTPGAVAAMTQAAAAGSGSGTDAAYVRTLVGDLHLNAGALDLAEASYRRTLADAPGYGMAEYGLARVAAARGDLDGSARLLSPLVTRLPFSAWVALMGDVEGARGHAGEAARQYELVRAIEALNRSNGINGDLEQARFEADHARDPGADAARAVTLAHSALADRPTIYAEDVTGWALRQAGDLAAALPHAHAAVRLGTADAVLWYHLAVIEADLGMSAQAAADVAHAFAINRYLNVRDLPAARQLAGRLGVSP